MITYFKNQTEIAMGINTVIDSYWLKQTKEIEMIETIEKIINNNIEKIFDENGDYRAILKQKCGKKRLAVISKIKCERN